MLKNMVEIIENAGYRTKNVKNFDRPLDALIKFDANL